MGCEERITVVLPQDGHTCRYALPGGMCMYMGGACSGSRHTSCLGRSMKPLPSLPPTPDLRHRWFSFSLLMISSLGGDQFQNLFLVEPLVSLACDLLAAQSVGLGELTGHLVPGAHVHLRRILSDHL